MSLFLTPGFTGEIPCFSQSGFPSINYFAGSGPEYTFWSSTGECSVTITKYDEERGRLKGMYHTEVVNVSAPTPVYGELVGCFSAKRQDIGVSAD